MSRLALINGVITKLHTVEALSIEEAEQLAVEIRADLATLEDLIAQAKAFAHPDVPAATPESAAHIAPAAEQPVATEQQPAEQPAEQLTGEPGTPEVTAAQPAPSEQPEQSEQPAAAPEQPAADPNAAAAPATPVESPAVPAAEPITLQ